MNYTDNQLKQALAKMLPDAVYYGGEMDQDDDLRWRLSFTVERVQDTGLLHLCWMVEEVLTKRECQDYTQGMEWEETPNTPPYDYVWHATWQQRVIALAKVKGVEIV